MKVRITGLPDEVQQAIEVLGAAETLSVVEVSAPYPNRGNSRLVRVYIEAYFSDSQEGTSERRSYASIQDTWLER